MVHYTFFSLAFTAFCAQLSASASVPQPPCTNTATTRSAWCRGFDINTNYYDKSPTTGRTREYYLTLEEIKASPDGFPREIYAFNGTFPGPTIVADWGDTVKVHITNKLFAARNGTTVHFHGVQQNYTNQMDGVASLTECPVPPGSSTTYVWKATQYGTSWYHSHIGLQAWEGAAGSIVINGPATANYDHDAGPVLLSDWSHTPVDALYSYALNHGPPQLTNGLIHGSNTWTSKGKTLGKRFAVPVKSGQSYRIRLINGAIDTHFKFTIDNHTMTVIAADFVPIVPYQTKVLDIAIGQRYDIIVKADKASLASNFWMRAIPQSACSSNANADGIRGIFHYGAAPGTPSTTGYPYKDACVDEPMAKLVPHLRLDAGQQDHVRDEPVGVDRSEGVFLWTMHSSSFRASWSDPTLLRMRTPATGTYFTDRNNVITVDGANKWEYLIIHSTLPVPHPIHLHGHDFCLLAQGTGPYNRAAALKRSNPPRRDVAMIPAAGHLVIAFKTDNPGVWLVHCHIGWHTDMGLALQVIEQYPVARGLVDYDRLQRTCKAWNDYTAAQGVAQYNRHETLNLLDLLILFFLLLILDSIGLFLRPLLGVPLFRLFNQRIAFLPELPGNRLVPHLGPRKVDFTALFDQSRARLS
ncbi:hypothetical protein LLEC1_06557, partial [Akanthomyces lecanii]